MKGILGRKVGMTQVFTEHGRAIPVTVIETQPNIVTAILTKEKHGYNAVQLGVEDIKKSRLKKPEVGHFKKSNTTPKKFVRELRNFELDVKLGDKVEASIFAAGEFVDVIGTSKGKGFAGAIKRHNQSIGPKSHGGGGGSQPQRQTGSLGDIAGNKVVKGMTMPGHMGHERVTVQNLEVIAVDTTHNVILVKGSIPGPRKSFVMVRNAIKLIPNKEAVVLANVQEAIEKNHLLEEAKHVGAEVNTDMAISEMKEIIKTVKDAKIAEEKAAKEAAKAKKAEQSKQEGDK